MTSSPGNTPANYNLICNAEVPLTHAIANFDLVYVDILVSKISTYFPADETHSVSMHSLTYFHSLPLKEGTERGILDIILVCFIKLKINFISHPINKLF